MKRGLSRAWRYTIGFGSVGIIITLLVMYVERNILDTYETNQPFIRLSDNIKNRSTKAHLWFEEYMAGDTTVNFNSQVLPLLESCEKILRASLGEEVTELGKFKNVEDPITIDLINKAIDDSHSLTTAAKQRYQFKVNAGNQKEIPDSSKTIAVLENSPVSKEISKGEEAGGKLDQQFDKSYEEVQETLDKLAAHIHVKVEKDAAFLDSVSWVLILVIIIAFSLLCFLVFRLQTGNDRVTEENTVRFHEENNRLNSISEFVSGISEGNYNIQLNSIGETEGIGAILITMRNKLKTNAETEQRRNWATTGIAQIGEILRTNTRTISELYDNIIRFMVKYTESNQGGMFIYNDENEANGFLELVACYAYERKKFLTKRINVGEGLVGQCFLEGEKIYMLDVPDEYVSITSGLGGANPSALLIVPMKVNGKIYGVIELASFNTFRQHEIELIEKLAESIASTIATVRTNESTRILLEKTQQQAEEMRAQEEEMRQNMEELEATQEEMSRKEGNYILKIERLESAIRSIAPDTAQQIIDQGQDVVQVVRKMSKKGASVSHKKMSYSNPEEVSESGNESALSEEN